MGNRRTRPSLHRKLVTDPKREYWEAAERKLWDEGSVIDFDTSGDNGRLSVERLTVAEKQSISRVEVVLFTNGLPFAMVDLTNPAEEKRRALPILHSHFC